jgi:hypothetical protein
MTCEKREREKVEVLAKLHQIRDFATSETDHIFARALILLLEKD